MKKIVIWIIVLIIIGIIVSAVTTFVKQSKAPNKNHTSTFTKGVSLSPKSFIGLDFQAFFQEAAADNDVITWAGDVDQLSKKSNAPYIVAGLASQYHYTPIIQVTTFHGSDGSLLRPFTSDEQEKELNNIKNFVGQFKPLYFGVGIEVNTLSEKNPSEFTAFATFFQNAVIAIHDVSPQTKVFTSFQLEKMKGLRGGLFGGENGADEWSLLNRFSAADVFAFTTYPIIAFGSPTEIPETYYSDILRHTNKPILISEIGWPSSLNAPGHIGNEANQEAFVKRFGTLVKPARPLAIVWSFLYDQNIGQPFTSMGLIQKNGTKKPAFGSWQSL